MLYPSKRVFFLIYIFRLRFCDDFICVVNVILSYEKRDKCNKQKLYSH